MEKIGIHRNTAATYTIQTKMHEGKQHLVVPVVMMVEGVHSGSRGPLLHTAEELGRFTAAWNGIPIVVHHPQDPSGNYISANSPQVIDREKVGAVYNTRIEDNKLKAEAWIQIDKISQVSPVALAHIRQGLPLDVSVGVFSDEEDSQGEWNGETYSAIARNHRPDHLALLPGEQGACSWQDGCGIRTNSSNSKSKANEKVMTEEEIAALKQQAVDNIISTQLNNNVSGFRERLDRIRSLVDSMDNETTIHYLEEVYDGYFIYVKRVRNSNGPTQETYLQQHYSMGANNVVELVGEPVPVVKNITYTTVQTNKMTRTKPIKQAMDVNSKSSCFLGKVERLIQSNKTHFTEGDKEWLLTQEESTLDKLMPKDTAIDVNSDSTLQAFRNTIKTEEDAIKLAPESVQANLRAGLKLYQAQRDALVEKIITNSEKDTWKKEELLAMSFETLEKIGKSIKTPVDYSLNGGQPPIQSNGEEEVLMPTGA